MVRVLLQVEVRDLVRVVYGQLRQGADHLLVGDEAGGHLQDAVVHKLLGGNAADLGKKGKKGKYVSFLKRTCFNCSTQHS